MNYVAGTIIYLWLFWGLYVLVMGIYRAHLAKRLSRAGYVMGLPWVTAGYVIDILANLTIATALFLEPPREWLVTTRFIRYKAGPPGWRRSIADWVCTHLLDDFDPTGDHC